MSEELEFQPSPSFYAPPATTPTTVPVDRELQEDLKNIPDKLAFKIGDVADLLKVKPYVLRYWESEFEGLSPKKSKQGQRMYERKDVEKLMMIKKLLYRDRYSIEGARAALKKLKKQGLKISEVTEVTETVEDVIQRMSDLVADIRRIKSMLA